MKRPYIEPKVEYKAKGLNLRKRKFVDYNEEKDNEIVRDLKHNVRRPADLLIKAVSPTKRKEKVASSTSVSSKVTLSKATSSKATPSKATATATKGKTSDNPHHSKKVKVKIRDNPLVKHTVKLQSYKRELLKKIELMDSEGILNHTTKMPALPKKKKVRQKLPQVNIPLTKQQAKKVIQEKLLLQLAQAGFTHTNQTPVEALADKVENFYKQITKNLKEAQEMGMANTEQEFPDILEKTLVEANLGGVRGVEKDYKKKVLEYPKKLEHQCNSLSQLYSHKIRTQVGTVVSATSESVNSTGGGNNASTSTTSTTVTASSTVSSSQHNLPGNSVLTGLLSTPEPQKGRSYTYEEKLRHLQPSQNGKLQSSQTKQPPQPQSLIQQIRQDQTPLGNNQIRQGQNSLNSNQIRQGQAPLSTNQIRQGQTPLNSNQTPHVQTPLNISQIRQGQTPLNISQIRQGQTPLSVNQIRQGQTPLSVNQVRQGQTPLSVNQIRQGQSPLSINQIRQGQGSFISNQIQSKSQPQGQVSGSGGGNNNNIYSNNTGGGDSKTKLKEALSQRNLLRLNFEQVPSNCGQSTVLLSSSSPSLSSSSSVSGSNNRIVRVGGVTTSGSNSSSNNPPPSSKTTPNNPAKISQTARLKL